ncbi:MAG: glycosyltransferase family A protein [Dehalococcoidia bacterium]
MNARPRLSLVLCTVDRVEEVDRFLASLEAQGVPDLEVLLVDQNEDDRLRPVIEAWRDRLAIRVLTSPRGLSRARNAALPAVRGEVVAFPDDDCEYPPGLLRGVFDRLDALPGLDGVSVRAVDQHGGGSGLRWARRASMLTPGTVLGRHISYGLFLRRDIVERTGAFDESLGVGASTVWGAGEETDFLLRALALGARVRYEPSLTAFHPAKDDARGARDDIEAHRRRLEAYGRGMGRVLRRHLPAWRAGWWIARPALASVWLRARGHRDEAGDRWLVARARFRGWMDDPGRPSDGGPLA